MTILGRHENEPKANKQRHIHVRTIDWTKANWFEQFICFNKRYFLICFGKRNVLESFICFGICCQRSAAKADVAFLPIFVLKRTLLKLALTVYLVL